MDFEKRFHTAISQNRLAHALLFLGDSQESKESLAIRLLSSLFCEKKQIPFGCQECSSCQQALERRHPYIRFLDSEIRIDHIRELITAAGNPSLIFSQAHLMSRQAANALLKTLEEPQNHRFFILIAPHTRSVLPTLLSRCQRIFFAPIILSQESEISSIPKELTQRLELAEQLSKDRAKLQQTLLKWQKQGSFLWKEKLLKALQDLSQYGNPQLILESLLFSLEDIN